MASVTRFELLDARVVAAASGTTFDNLSGPSRPSAAAAAFAAGDGDELSALSINVAAVAG